MALMTQDHAKKRYDQKKRAAYELTPLIFNHHSHHVTPLRRISFNPILLLQLYRGSVIW